jgi:transcriptional regulator with XRE-family HTH domain/tetratricopeptide (TPR) repeat protein
VSKQPVSGFAELLQRLRVRAGLTQEELAAAAAVSPRTVSDIERGINRTARRDTALWLAAALGLTGPEREAFEAAARGKTGSPATQGTQRPDSEVPGARASAVPPPGGFARVLRQQRLAAALTQEELAEASGVSPRQISDLERGINQTARRETARLLADGLRLTGREREAFEAAARGRPLSAGGASAATAPTRQTLPRDLVSFTGREPELARITSDVLTENHVGIYVVNGMAGVGKTALAVHAAHRLAPMFPEGQLFVPLHARVPGGRPADPSDALASLLVTVGVDARQMPDGLEERSGLWRDYSAGRRLLLLLDDAADSDQVRPLLPGSAGSLVLVTSRRRLALMDAEGISLGALPPDEAAGLFRRLAARPDLERDTEAVNEIVRMSGGLPLALAVLAHGLRYHPSWTGADVAADLAAAPDRLELMNAADLSVAAAFDRSYQDLSDAQQRMFRSLGLQPGPVIDAYAAAALAGTEARTARRQLEQLYDAGLLEEPARGSYRLHDLVREYARSVAVTDQPAEREAAIGRLLDYYLQTARAAARQLGSRLPEPGPADGPAAPATARPVLPGRAEAQAWLEAELDNLQVTADLAAATGRPDYVTGLSAAVHEFLRSRGHWRRALTLHQAAVRAASSVGRLEEARALTDLGAIQHLTDDYEAAAASLAEALALYRELGDRLGEAGALVGLGGVRQATGDYEAAAASLAEALALYRELGDRLGEAGALVGLGGVRQATGDYEAAAASLAEALALYRELGDRLGEADALVGLGTARLAAGDHAAAGYLAEALERYRFLGHLSGEAETLKAIGLSRIQGGQPTQGLGPLQEALALYRQIGSPEAGQVELALATHGT